jgi:nucleotide-binding universal stress UspA family protein
MRQRLSLLIISQIRHYLFDCVLSSTAGFYTLEWLEGLAVDAASFERPSKNSEGRHFTQTCRIKADKPCEVICKEAGRKKVDLIVIGTHSKKGLQAAIGSTAA